MTGNSISPCVRILALALLLKRSPAFLRRAGSRTDNNCISRRQAQAEKEFASSFLSRTTTNTHSVKLDSFHFLSQVETTVSRVLAKYEWNANILELAPPERESLGVARNLDKRLRALRRNGDCPRCWLQRAHCICEQCPPLGQPTSKVHRIFLLMHHKEVGLIVDTAKMILAAFPENCRWVVGGIGPDFQASMREMMQAINDPEQSSKCMVLFPTDTARTFQQIESEAVMEVVSSSTNNATTPEKEGWDIIVIDGTWSQARKLFERYILSTRVRQVKLGTKALELLGATNFSRGEEGIHPGHQLRRHPVSWREVSTMEALRLFLQDITRASGESSNHFLEQMVAYQETANKAAKKQLGPPRRPCSTRSNPNDAIKGSLDFHKTTFTGGTSLRY